MNSRRPLALALMLAFAVTTGGAGAFAGDDVPKPTVKRATLVKEASRTKKEVSAAKPAAPRAWRRSSDQPCDSAACRPFRFAWSPVAPGA